jgi:hypothetical protein
VEYDVIGLAVFLTAFALLSTVVRYFNACFEQERVYRENILEKLADMIVDHDLDVTEQDELTAQFIAWGCAGSYILKPEQENHPAKTEVRITISQGRYEVYLYYEDDLFVECRVDSKELDEVLRSDSFFANGILASIQRSMRVQARAGLS